MDKRLQQTCCMSGWAVDIGGTKTTAARFDDGEIVERLTAPSQSDLTVSGHLDAIDSFLCKLSFSSGERLAVAVTGRVDDAGRWYAINADTLKRISGLNLSREIVNRFGSNNVVLNDVAAAALGEAEYGAGYGVEHVGFISVSTGIGGGFVLNGQLLQSSNGLAGHVGFMSSPYGNDLCGSGRTGTVESIASGTAIAQKASQRLGENISTQMVFNSWRQGETWASDIVNLSAKAVACLCADLNSAFGLERIVFGGGVGLADGYLDLVREHLAKLPALFHVDLAPAALGQDSPLYGALHQSVKS